MSTDDFEGPARRRRRGAVVHVEAELELGGFRHAAFVPRRIEDDIDLDFAHLGQGGEFALDFSLDHVRHCAAGRGQRHADRDPLAAGFGIARGGFVDKAEIDDVYRNLRIAHGLELLPDHFVPEGAGRWRGIWIGFGDGHGGLSRYSVETDSCLPSSADWSVCQASVAHFTRAGNFETPAKTASLPSSVAFSMATLSPVTRR